MKYYAVKVGKNPGIFDNWSDCSESIKGFPNADFKAFPSREEAEAYLNNIDLWGDRIKVDIDNEYIVAFCDGSYDDKLKRYSYGVLLIDSDLKENELCGYFNNPKYLPNMNIAGEIFGVIYALDWAVSNGYSKIKIYYDYEGIQKWASGEWRAESEIAKMFVAIFQIKYAEILQVEFEKIKGHSNNKYNDKADELAKKALADRTKLVIKGDSWFTLPHFKEDELQTVLDLLKEEHSEIQIEKSDTDLKTVYKLQLYRNKLTISLFKSGKRNLLVQGANSLLLQMVISFVSELAGINQVESILNSTYKTKIDSQKIINHLKNTCPTFPVDYPDDIKILIKQSIINLYYYVEGVEYSQYTFSALKALEGHMKYIFNKNNIAVKDSFVMFDRDKNDNSHILKPNCGINDAITKAKLEKYYNYYYANRHTIFHYGDITGTTNSTRMIESKEEADEIIKKCIEYICE